MQAPGSLHLSAQQRNSLELTYTYLRGVTAFLESIEGKLQADDQLVARNLRDLASTAERRLVEAFPELHAWLAEWTRGGVS